MLAQSEKISGFTLIELLIVIAIVAIIGATTIPIGSSFLVKNHLSNKTNELVSSLKTAQINSMNGKQDVVWGVEVNSTEIKLFSSGDTSFDQIFAIPPSVNITQDTVLFDKLTGNPDSTATFTITTNANDSSVITVNEVGTINVN